MNKESKITINNLIYALLFLVFGIILLTSTEDLITIVSRVMGSVLCIIGLVNSISYIYMKGKLGNYNIGKLIIGLAFISFGILLISFSSALVLNGINNTKSEDITISLGSFTGISILSGRGIKVPIRISTIGTVKTNVRSEFLSKGINQTLHRLYLDIESEISILTPFNTISEHINNQLILAENIIVGEIPETYYNLDGMRESDVMEVMQ